MLNNYLSNCKNQIDKHTIRYYFNFFTILKITKINNNLQLNDRNRVNDFVYKFTKPIKQID